MPRKQEEYDGGENDRKDTRRGLQDKDNEGEQKKASKRNQTSNYDPVPKITNNIVILCHIIGIIELLLLVTTNNQQYIHYSAHCTHNYGTF
jgi:hypothetical protein